MTTTQTTGNDGSANTEPKDVQQTDTPVESTMDATELRASADAEPEAGVRSPNTSEPETFPREYVEKLRQEAADARVKAKKADDMARALFHARVAATGRLADPSDLVYDEALLDDHAAMEAAIEELIARKPHMATRTPRGDIGLGYTPSAETVDLAAILRSGAF